MQSLENMDDVQRLILIELTIFGPKTRLQLVEQLRYQVMAGGLTMRWVEITEPFVKMVLGMMAKRRLVIPADTEGRYQATWRGGALVSGFVRKREQAKGEVEHPD